MTNKYPQSVSSSLLMSKYIFLIGNMTDSSEAQDECVSFFLRERMLALQEDGIFRIGERWARVDSMDNTLFNELFKQYICEQSLFTSITNSMDDDVWTNKQDILKACETDSTESDVDTMLLWMEEYRVISSNSKREYKLTEKLTDEETSIEEGSIYPLSYKNRLNIEDECVFRTMVGQ